MPKKKIGIHACWLDRDCRKDGVPAFTYFFCWWFTVWINPPHDRLAHKLEGRRKFRWDLIQTWKNR